MVSPSLPVGKASWGEAPPTPRMSSFCLGQSWLGWSPTDPGREETVLQCGQSEFELPQLLPWMIFIWQGRYNPRAQVGDQTLKNPYYSPLSQGQRRHSPWFLKEALLLNHPSQFLDAETKHQAWTFSATKKSRPCMLKMPFPKRFFFPLSSAAG